jgi:integrase
MAKAKTTTATVVGQSSALIEKPRPDFPLTPHKGSGQWCKKINGRVRYFGKLDNPAAAEANYNSKRVAYEDGREPRPIEVLTGRVDVAFACNSFLNAKRKRVESGEISERTWQELLHTSKLVTLAFGRDRLVSDLRGEDFDNLRAQLAKRLGPVRLANEIQRVRSIFKFALADGLIASPVQFGASFTPPSRRIMRVSRADRGPRMFKPEQCRQMVGAASDSMKAMILLGLNGGFTSRDCGTLPREAVDLKAGFIDYARPKTGVHRRVPLWPETVAALKKAMATTGDLAFLTERGTSFAKGKPGNDPIGLTFRRLLARLKLQREGLGFATLRHVFQTVAERSRDFPAVKAVMGHVDDSISEKYREQIDDDRLRATVDCVRVWLFAKSTRKDKI